jgi:uncharacterized Ntn-hydrolase superfamily protein
MTYSIVAYDPDENAWGVAVASKFLAAGAVVNWARAGAGAIATQAFAKVGYGPDGLDLLAAGKSAQQTLDVLIGSDPQAANRQIGIVDTQGRVAAHTGENCSDWAGHYTGKNFSCQGNILTGQDTLNAMAKAFTSGRGELADRLIAALLAGDTIGGDKRGKQSAGILVVRPDGGYGHDNDRYLDLRVDDDDEPVKRLKGLVAIHHLFFGTPKPEDQITIIPEVAVEIQRILLATGYFAGEPNGEWDDMSKQAFWALIGNENLEERWSISGDTDRIDRIALEYLRNRFS